MVPRPAVAALTLGAAVTLAPGAVAITPTVAQCLSTSEQGQADRDEGRYKRARDAFVSCSNDACPVVVRRDCLKWLSELDASAPTIVFVARDERGADLGDVTVRVDGEVLTTRLDGKPINVDPGRHELEMEAAGRRASRMAIIVNAGERSRIVQVRLDAAEPPPSPRPPPPPPPEQTPAAPAPRVPVASIILGGAGALSVGVAAYLWLSARSDLDALENSPCAVTKSCDASDVRSVRARLVVGDVLALAGLAAIGAGAWLWLTRASDVTLAVAPTSGGGGALRVGGRF
jgi:hypothetical protein